MPRLTIIVPACGSQYDLDNTLVSVLENRPARSEILVPHAQAYQDPYDLSDEVRFVSTPGEDLVDLLNAGIEASRSRIVHILQPGIEATPGWTDAVMRRFAADVSLAAVSPRLCTRSNASRADVRGIRFLRGGAKRTVLVEAKAPDARKTARIWEGPSLQAGFYRRCALISIGQLDPQLGDYLGDVDVIAKLRRSGWRCEHEPDSRLTGDLPLEPVGFRAGRRAERLFWRHIRARGTVSSLLHHAWVTTSDLVRQLPRLSVLSTSMGRSWGLLECLLLRRHAWMSEPATEDDEPADSCDHHAQDVIPIAAAKERLRARKKSVAPRAGEWRTGR